VALKTVGSRKESLVTIHIILVINKKGQQKVPMAKITKTIDLKKLIKKLLILILLMWFIWLVVYFFKNMNRSSLLSPNKTKDNERPMKAGSEVRIAEECGNKEDKTCKRDGTGRSECKNKNDGNGGGIVGGNVTGVKIEKNVTEELNRDKDRDIANEYKEKRTVSTNNNALNEGYQRLKQFLSQGHYRKVYTHYPELNDETGNRWKEGDVSDAIEKLMEKMRNKCLSVEIIR
ncbi:hypothetical protein THOM_1453, partial [Trachipleistophora hominis]